MCNERKAIKLEKLSVESLTKENELLRGELEQLKSAIKTVTLRKRGQKKPLAKIYRKDGYYHCDALGDVECTITTERGERIRLHK